MKWLKSFFGLSLIILCGMGQAQATTFTFDEGNGTDTYLTQTTAQWTEAGYTVSFLVSGGGTAYPSLGQGDGILGSSGYTTSRWTVTNGEPPYNPITITVSISGKVFDFGSFDIYDEATEGGATYSILTSKGGTGSGPVTPSDAHDTHTYSGANFTGISSFTLTFNTGSPGIAAVSIDNLILNNIANPSATITFANGSGFAPSITKGSANQALGRFQLTGDISGAALTAASIKLNGTRTSLTNLKLWSSTDATYGGDTQVGSTVAADPGNGSSVSFSSFSSSIGTSGTYYFLTGDVSAGATGDVQGVIVQNSNLTISSGTLSGTIANAPMSNGDASLPIGLASFSASQEGGSIILSWITESEVDNLGFILERSEDGITWTTLATYRTNEALKSQGNTSSRTEYAFADLTARPDKEYWYRLSDVSTLGEATVYAPLTVKTDALPNTTEMEKAYPNPFNPQTFIAYKLAEDTDVAISVFDMLGRQISTLYNGYQKAGSYHVYWNGTTESGMKAPSGGYVIRMRTENTTQVQKVMLMK
jgi:hypothetical protein